MNSDLWTNEFLDSMRQVTDPLADAAVGEVFAKGEVGAVNALLRDLMANDQVVPDQLPKSTKDYFESAHLPDWVDVAKLLQAQEFFAGHGPTICVAMLFSSLPMCYACAKGVQVLHLTARLQSDAKRRIAETSQLVIRVMNRGGLGPGGQGLRDAQKVRLMHAAIRHLILHPHRVPVVWDPGWGEPINQEDQAGTLLAFSYIPVIAMRKLGIDVTKSDAEAYLHAWNVVGSVLGVTEDLMAHDEAAASALVAMISRRHFAESEAGRALTQALIEMVEHTVPGSVFDGLPATLIRFLNQEPVADLLNVPPADWWERRGIRFIGADRGILERHEDHDPLLAGVVELLGRHFMNALGLIDRGGQRPPFEIPPYLRERWNLQAAHESWWSRVMRSARAEL
jgi:hypothetical protein